MSQHPFGPMAARHEVHKHMTQALVEEIADQVKSCDKTHSCTSELHFLECASRMDQA